MIEKVIELKNKLSSLRPLNSGELKRLRNDFIINNTYNSNAIEGSTITLRETALILEAGITIGEKPLKEHLEVIGHKDAFEYVYELASANTELSERVIKDIHTLVLMNDRENRGVYRSVPVRIIGAKHTPPPPYQVPELIEQLLIDYKELLQSKNIIEAVAELHLMFESIHPFIDGNGRTGRLLLNLELIKNGLLPINIKFTDRMKYYNVFDEYATEKSCNALINMIYEYEISELEEYISIIENKAEL